MRKSTHQLPHSCANFLSSKTILLKSSFCIYTNDIMAASPSRACRRLDFSSPNEQACFKAYSMPPRFAPFRDSIREVCYKHFRLGQPLDNKVKLQEACIVFWESNMMFEVKYFPCLTVAEFGLSILEPVHHAQQGGCFRLFSRFQEGISSTMIFETCEIMNKRFRRFITEDRGDVMKTLDHLAHTTRKIYYVKKIRKTN